MTGGAYMALFYVRGRVFSSPKSPKSPHQDRCVRGLLIQEPGGSQVGRVFGTFIVQLRAYEAWTGPGIPKYPKMRMEGHLDGSHFFWGGKFHGWNTWF